jgi:hypothetical protein
MSRRNKVNPDHYKLAGRLSADDIARERMRQTAPRTGRTAAKGGPTPQSRKVAATARKKAAGGRSSGR